MIMIKIWTGITQLFRLPALQMSRCYIERRTSQESI